MPPQATQEDLFFQDDMVDRPNFDEAIGHKLEWTFGHTDHCSGLMQRPDRTENSVQMLLFFL